MKINVFDIECDGFNPTKIHCLTVAVKSNGKWVLQTTTDYDVMRKFFLGAEYLAGHNIIRFDIPVVERILDIKIKAKVIETLALSWYLYPTRARHGLAFWGEAFGVSKPEIEDWEGLPIEEYINRCEEDVKINYKLLDKQLKDLSHVYESEEALWALVTYLTFKLKCAREAEENTWLLDREKCDNALVFLKEEKEKRVEELKTAMPKVPIISIKKCPSKPYLKDGVTLSAMGKKWIGFLEERSLSLSRIEPVEYISGYNECNPNSPAQVKSWLTQLGWKPRTFSYVNKVTEEGKKYVDAIPQVRKDIGGEKILCDSVKVLIEEEPAIEALEGLSVLSHRIGLLEGFVKNVREDGSIPSIIMGLTNTLRFRHTVLVNLPSINKPYGELVRGSLTCEEGYVLCGSDMASLEDRTKVHYMWDHDPEYVKEMSTDGYDPHCALAVFAGAMTTEQVIAHKNKKEDYSKVRHLYKTANYSCTYGAGGKKLALTLDIPVAEGQGIVDAYRSKNWSIDAISANVKTKTVYGQQWLYNPVSKFWYTLRHDKDRFSTLNQGTGVYAFDVWIGYMRQLGLKLMFQYHDEVVIKVLRGEEERVKEILFKAIKMTNNKLKLNRELDVDVQFGTDYSQIH